MTLERWGQILVLAGILIGIEYFGAVIIAWMFRGRWAGSLRLSMKTADNRIVAFLVFAMNAPNILRDLFRPGKTHLLDRCGNIALLTLMALLVIYAFVVFRKLELRDRGILFCGRLISWLKIDHYDWEASALGSDLISLSIARPSKAVLCLYLKRRFSFMQPLRIRLGEGDRTALETILSRRNISRSI